jgi:invasion protein IalB
MNKKLILTVIAVLVLLLGALGIKTTTNKNIQKGNKTITINIVSKVDNLNEKEEINTDEEKLGPVLLNKGFKIENGMVLKINNIDLTNSDSEFWHITVNGEDAKVGVNDQLIKNGDVIKFERIKFK